MVLSITNALSTVIGCSASDSQTILVTNISNTILTTGTNLSISVDNINNPITTRTVSSIFYETFYSLALNTNPVDDSTGFILSFTPAPITIPSANFLATRTDETNLAFASYTFTYTVFTTFAANGYLTISMPPSMVLSSGATANYVLSTSATNTTISMTSTTSLSETSVVLNFNGAITTTLPANTIFTITINNIQNYFSFKPVNMQLISCLLYTSPSPRDLSTSRMPSSA